jgi:hypothetical protein
MIATSSVAIAVAVDSGLSSYSARRSLRVASERLAGRSSRETNRQARTRTTTRSEAAGREEPRRPAPQPFEPKNQDAKTRIARGEACAITSQSSQQLRLGFLSRPSRQFLHFFCLAKQRSCKLRTGLVRTLGTGKPFVACIRLVIKLVQALK